ncbi:MAG TPA: PH domain-containing protein [Phycicoccus elongatus]|jgi:membrane protein YdbS with pleckstrin-like domain|uniref:PH domain-containing protein n=1 Tax=Phycicoccus TaxID=367298 RepID=UPI001D831625|nr:MULTISPECIES: PH domain-containing protein [Phycicoccus]MCA0323000.1 PH domain-containing protein [Actinomycetota bacterium]MCB1238780.1 PH domain-containing protein [Tetrasphaera sp.]MCB9405270.1 PH domain-containing protein [Tetrasphaera sp.]HPF76468.1 PH domain-containing protein [Phycicoccus elongatus]HPK11740.1 PH domain-containing protein [Phycicoccus elongatus]
MSDLDADPAPRVTLRGGDLGWRSVSPALVKVRLITLAVTLVVPLVATVVLAVLVTPWVWLGTLALMVAAAIIAWVIVRQVSAISWIELEEELVIRKGRLIRSLVSVPYGRLQFVDVQSGPLMRAFGLSTLQLHTANPATSATISGLEVPIAEDLRARLSARGETQRAGL